MVWYIVKESLYIKGCLFSVVLVMIGRVLKITIRFVFCFLLSVCLFVGVCFLIDTSCAILMVSSIS